MVIGSEFTIGETAETRERLFHAQFMAQQGDPRDDHDDKRQYHRESRQHLQLQMVQVRSAMTGRVL